MYNKGNSLLLTHPPLSFLLVGKGEMKLGSGIYSNKIVMMGIHPEEKAHDFNSH